MLASGRDGLASVVFYVLIYGLTTVGAFGVVSIVQDRAGGDALSSFAGLSKRAPILSFCMMIFMLSLAGIPPLAGFFGKFYLFTAALKSTPESLGYLWLVLAAIALSAVSLYYYLQVLKQIYVVAPADEASAMQTPVLSQVILALLALAVLVLGCAPNLLLGLLTSAIQVAGF